MNEVIIFKKGFNGSATYSLYEKENLKTRFTDKTLEGLSKDIVREFPEMSEQISKFYESDFSSDFPEKVDFSKLDSTPKSELIKLISLELNRSRKVKV